MISVPEWLTSPIKEITEFCEEHEARRLHGSNVLESASIAIVGLARNCGSRLAANLVRLSALTRGVSDWRCLICENDSTDDTKEIAKSFVESSCGHATAITRDFGRKHRPNEFAGPRTQELAEYRAECQEWVRQTCSHSDYTIVIDWDAWGGWVLSGAMTAFSYLATEEGAFGMASVSLMEHPILQYDHANQSLKKSSQWIHYDCWALRLNSYWDDYQSGAGGWKHNWFPPVGSAPVRVCSAFGGFAVYKTADFLRGTYSGQDCEHVTFHRSIQEATGRGLYLNPSQRTVMQWIEQDAKHHDNPDQPVPG